MKAHYTCITIVFKKILPQTSRKSEKSLFNSELPQFGEAAADSGFPQIGEVTANSSFFSGK
jgi:hypothetical protein